MSLLSEVTVLAVDTETTGMDPAVGARLVEVAHVRIAAGALAEEWSSLVKPGVPIPIEASRVHGISDAMVADAPAMAEVGRTWRAALGDHPLVFHNAPFDLPFLVHLFREAGEPPLTNPIVDTLGLARGLFGSSGNKLGELATRFQLPSETAHRALGDTRTTARLFLELAGRWEREKGVRSIMELAAVSQDVMRATARR